MVVLDNHDPSVDMDLATVHSLTSSEMAERSLEAEIKNISKANLKRIDPNLQSKEAGRDMESWSSDGYLEEPPGSTSNVLPPKGSTESMDMQCENGGDFSVHSF
nr:hypothetical protein CFP56_43603 [Quercus suber]